MLCNEYFCNMANLEKIILGIDPGTNILGYGVIAVTGNKVKMEALGVIDLRKCADVYLKLGRIYERIDGLIEAFHPDELAIEAPFFGKNVQSMLKLGRAQGVAIAAAINRDIPIFEYAPKAGYYLPGALCLHKRPDLCRNYQMHPSSV